MSDTEVMTIDEATGEVVFWAYQTEAVRDRAFSELLGWVAGRAVDDRDAADLLLQIRGRAHQP
jgi:hypothetical protein